MVHSGWECNCQPARTAATTHSNRRKKRKKWRKKNKDNDDDDDDEDDTNLLPKLLSPVHAFTSDLPSVFQSFRCQTGYVGVSRVSRAAALESAISGCMSGTHAKTTNRTKNNKKTKPSKSHTGSWHSAALAGSSLLWRHVSVLTAGGAVAAP